ncbi:hypothetical protein [Cognatiluteimonas profundi]|uniref:hypothetical protein n=1 Tax=Cognatiluteimonas profundi TaxID=2594501 RepID=UPI00131CEC82|nr:hypothetical protein [Lysobacter profundi]
MADTADRRLPINESSGVLKRGLNEEQLLTLYTLERFGWELKFIRGSASHKEAVLFDPDSRKYAVLGVDGTVDDNPIFHRFR